MKNNPTEVIIKPYTKKDLRMIMGIHRNTFRKWLDKLPEAKIEKNIHWLTTPQVKMILEKYGAMKAIDENKF